jgi:hypothetical protein
VLAAIMALAGLERIFAQGRGQPAPHGWRAALRTIGAIPALGLVALGVAVALVGAVQGTLAPQFLYAAQSSLTWGAAPAEFAAGLLTLLLASAALLFFVLDPAHHLANQPAWVQRLMGGWLWIGQRAVWVAAGALFARLFAARLALLITEVSGWLWRFQLTGLGELFASWWRMVTGA